MLFLCKSFLPLSVDTHKSQVFLLFANPRRKFSFFHLFFFSRTRDREMKTRAAFCGGKKKSTSSLPSFQKSGVSNSAFFHCVFSAENVINIYTFRTSSNYTHCRYARASSFSLSAVVRANDVQEEEEEHSSSLSFFLYSHPRVHKLFSIIIIHNS